MRGGNVRRIERARALRKVGNEAGETLWYALRGRRPNGCVRQYPIGPYFADFALGGGLVKKPVSTEMKLLPAMTERRW
jgi:very-short-patch-repair endonuclease